MRWPVEWFEQDTPRPSPYKELNVLETIYGVGKLLPRYPRYYYHHVPYAPASIEDSHATVRMILAELRAA